MSKTYFVDICGNLLEYERVEPMGFEWAAPAIGCDMLIRDSHGHLSSANSKSYHDTPQDALRVFLARQEKYIKAAEDRLIREKEHWINAHQQLISKETASVSEETVND